MSYISIVANNAIGVMDSWERVTNATAKNQLVNLEAKEFEQQNQAEEHAYSRFINRFYTRNHWRAVNIPLPSELPCNQIFIDDGYEEREVIQMINVTPNRDVPLLDYTLKNESAIR